MNNNNLFKVAKLFFAIAIAAIGIIHISIANFPAGLLPVPASLPAKALLAYITGAVLIISSVLMFVKKYSYSAAFLSAVTWLILLLLVHLPKLLKNVHDGGEWTATFEVFELFSGSLILAGNILAATVISTNKNARARWLIITGRIMFATGLIVFGVQHYLYADYIATLITSWIPAHLFWSYFVMVAFFAAALSFLIQKQVHLAGVSLGLMFFLWVVILRSPRAITNPALEPEWTSLFIALAMCGISLLIASSSSYKKRI